MIYLIMNKDVPVVKLQVINNFIEPFHILGSSKRFPFSSSDSRLNSWINRRKLPFNRINYKELARESGITDTLSYVNITKCVSLNDTIWIKKLDDASTWSDVSPYTNPFNRAMSELCLITGKQGSKLDISLSPEMSSKGMFPKCWKRRNGKLYLLKGASIDEGVWGIEPYSEFFAYQVALQFKFKRVLSYDLEIYNDRLVSVCPCFTSEKYGFMPMNDIYPDNAFKFDLDYFTRLGCGDDFRRMLVLDSILMNRDRHRGNFGIIFRNSNFTPLALSPVFDNNLALMPFIDLLKSTEAIKERIERGNRSSETGTSFIEQAKMVMTKDIYKEVLALRGFKVKQHKTVRISQERLAFINSIIKRQVEEILVACKEFS